ncbi:MAG: hypothetical protein IID39_09675 [Planctomycetes bacterium]|nr:hypothetical protein [Planctomycetota bacterium]
MTRPVMAMTVQEAGAALPARLLSRRADTNRVCYEDHQRVFLGIPDEGRSVWT